MAKNHKSNSEEFTIENANNITPIVYCTLIVALMFAIVYVMTHISQEVIFLFSQGIMGYNTPNGFVEPNPAFVHNISNIGYLLQGVLMVCIPVNFLVGQKNSYIKIILLKVLIYAVALTYLLGESWILKWLFDGIFGNGFTWDMLRYQKENAFVFNHMAWGSNNPMCIVFDLIGAGGWALIAHNINNDYKKMHKYYILTMIGIFAIPLVFFAIRLLLGIVAPGVFKTGRELITELGVSYQDGKYNFWWYTKSAFYMCYLIVMAFYFWYTSQNESRYEEYTCEIGSVKEIIKRSKMNYRSSKLSNLFGNDARKYYKDDMKESIKRHKEHKKAKATREEEPTKDIVDSKIDSIVENANVTDGETEVLNETHEHHHHHHSSSHSTNEDGEHHHHHHHSSSHSSSGDGEHHHHHHHHHHSDEPQNWQPVTSQKAKNGVQGAAGAMRIDEILNQQGVVATTVNSLPNAGAMTINDIIGQPGVAVADTKAAAANIGNANIEEMIQMQQIQATATQQQQLLEQQAQMAQLQQQLAQLQQQQQIEQLQRQIEELKKATGQIDNN